MSESRRFHVLGIVLIAFLSFGLYLNSFNNAFVFDDIPNIVENPYIKNLRDLPLFIEGIKVRSQGYRVLPTLSFAIHYHFHKLHVWGYHLTNLMFHLLSGTLVYFLARRLLTLARKKMEGPLGRNLNPGEREINLSSLLAAAFFVSHPIQVNTVTYIVERNEGLAGLFYLLAFLLFVKGMSSAGSRKILFLSGCGFSFLCSVFSKETGFTLPVVLILFDLLFVCRSREETLRRVKIYLPLFLSLSIYILFFLNGGMLWMLTRGSETWKWTPWENLLTQTNVFIQYFKLLLLPLPQWLNVDHDFQVSKTLFETPTLISAAVLVFILILATMLIRKKPLISFCLYWFFIVLAPTSTILPLWDIMVEYRLYLCLFPFALILVLTLEGLRYVLARFTSKKVSQGAVWGISILILGCYAVITVERNAVFKNDLTLWTDASKKSPNKMRCKINLIGAYHQHGLYDQAIATSLEVLKSHPDDHEIYTKLGISYMFIREDDRAIEMLKTSIQLKRDNPKAYNNLGILYVRKKDFDQGITEFRQAIYYRPVYAEAYSNLANALAMKGLLDEAIQEVRGAIRIDPTLAEYHYNLARFYEGKGSIHEAAGEYREALRYDSKFFDAFLSLGILYSRMGDHSGAIRELEKAQRLNPRSGRVHFMLGVNFLKTKEVEKAVLSLEMALRLATNDTDRKAIETVLNQLRSRP